MAHQPRLNHGMIFHHKTIIYLLLFFEQCHKVPPWPMIPHRMLLTHIFLSIPYTQ
jgi:hypothetical protein